MFNTITRYTVITFDNGQEVSRTALSRFNNGNVVGQFPSSDLEQITAEVKTGKVSGVIVTKTAQGDIISHWGITGVESDNSF